MDSSIGQQRLIEILIKAACGNQLHIKERKGERKKRRFSRGKAGHKTTGGGLSAPRGGRWLSWGASRAGGSLAIVATENRVLKRYCAVSK